MALFFWAINVVAQNTDVSGYLKKVSEAYVNTENLSLNVNVTGVLSENNGEIKIAEGKIRKKGWAYYTSYDGVELIMKKHRVLTVNHIDKTISFEVTEKSVSEAWEMIKRFSNIDSLGAKIDTAMVEELPGGDIKLSLRQANATIERTDVTLNSKTNLIKKVVYYYGNADEEFNTDLNKVIITYTDLKGNDLGDDYFSINRFIKKVNDNYIKKPEYAGYKLSLTGATTKTGTP